LDGHFMKDLQVVNNYMQWCLTAEKRNFMAIIKMNNNKYQLSHIAGGNIKWCSSYGKQFDRSSKN
jgi:hypothetical protein